ncbi:MAG: hypothetical protein J4O03_15360 [Chloroflexi bacterium]|nr:hypothetical protein [Chloroflexota bacterium]MCI0786787.1 hypothetical protein [Chloroflexota bacterium]MCI0794840.1 hypothetical protein [Chloroflexota bacterium]MCI0799355.1 hypothetical protein [Chloroflexota bacterium]MCI0859146.1 hypothetical protein [Chloroflexota bacterium]
MHHVLLDGIRAGGVAIISLRRLAKLLEPPRLLPRCMVATIVTSVV